MEATATTPKTFEELREERGWTPIDVARRVGWVSERDLAEWEAGSVLWETAGLPDLAKAGGVPLSGVARPPSHRFEVSRGRPFAAEARGLDDTGWTAEVAAGDAGETASTAGDRPEGFAPFWAKSIGRTADEACDAPAAAIDARPAGGWGVSAQRSAPARTSRWRPRPIGGSRSAGAGGIGADRYSGRVRRLVGR